MSVAFERVFIYSLGYVPSISQSFTNRYGVWFTIYIGELPDSTASLSISSTH